MKHLLLTMGLLWFFWEGVRGLKMSHKNNAWEENFAAIRSVDDALEGDFYHDLKMGPEKLPIEVRELDKNVLVEEETEKEKLTVVDEETIRKAEKEADKDLLNGLNRILKNNETLKDVLRAENIYKIP